MIRKKYKPPRFAEWILRRLSIYNEKHSINGDIEELYNEIINEKGNIAAFLWYWLQTLLTVFTYLKLALNWSFVMIKNYFKITFRIMRKYKSFSIINIFGFGTGIACCLPAGNGLRRYPL